LEVLVIGALFFTPGSSLVLGLLIFAGILVVGRFRGSVPARAELADEREGPARAADRQLARRRRFLLRLALVAPWVIVAPFVVIEATGWVHTLLRYTAPHLADLFSSDPTAVRWWWYAASPAAAAVCMAVVLGVFVRERVRPETPVIPVVRRGWVSFLSPQVAVVAIVALALFTITTLVAGAASRPDDNGWYSILEIPVGDGAGSSTFFGWAYGVPALVAIAALTALVWASLRADALRPFVRPETVAAETESRRVTAALLARLFTATVLLTLGGAWLMIGGAGTSSVGFSMPGVGTYMFSAGYASFAPAFVVAGVGLQTVAVVLLLLTIHMRRRLDPKPAASAPSLSDVAA
jgi:hypothetical protein